MPNAKEEDNRMQVWGADDEGTLTLIAASSVHKGEAWSQVYFTSPWQDLLYKVTSEYQDSKSDQSQLPSL